MAQNQDPRSLPTWGFQTPFFPRKCWSTTVLNCQCSKVLHRKFKTLSVSLSQCAESITISKFVLHIQRQSLYLRLHINSGLRWLELLVCVTTKHRTRACNLLGRRKSRRRKAACHVHQGKLPQPSINEINPWRSRTMKPEISRLHLSRMAVPSFLVDIHRIIAEQFGDQVIMDFCLVSRVCKSVFIPKIYTE